MMAYQYDEMGNVIGEYESEEERRQREEAAKQLAHKVEVKTYGDGSQTQTTTREVPAPVAGPVPFNPADYNRSIAAQESGANPNIGYHNQQLSSAYGPYGMTAGAWQDARRANPNLPADITQATPEQMTAGQTAFTGQNAKYLQNYGVPVNDNTLSAAHFLGAKGLSNYLQSGYISPQAAAANGGEENVRRIVDQRLGGNFAPASGAVQPQTPQAAAQPQTPQAVTPVSPYSLSTGQTGLGLQAPGGITAAPQTQQTPMTTIDQMNMYQQNQDNVKELMGMKYNDSLPEFIRNRAGNRAFEIMNQQVKDREFKDHLSKLTTDLQNPGTARQASNTIARELQNKDASPFKYWFFKLIGQPEAAAEEAVKLGYGNTEKVVQDDAGRAYQILFNARGTPLSGISADGKQLTQEELINATAGALGKGVHVTKVDNLINPKTGERIQQQTMSDGKTRYRKGGEAYTGDKSGFEDANQWESDQDRKMNAVNAHLNRQYPGGATDAQKLAAYKQAGVNPRYIESLMGMQTGALTGEKTSAEAGKSAEVLKQIEGGKIPGAESAQAATATPGGKEPTILPKPQPGSVTLPSGRPFDPNSAPEAQLGQSEASHKADVNAWKIRHNLYTKQVDSISEARNSAEQTLADINMLLAHPGLAGNLGKTGILPNIPGSEASNAKALLDKIKGGTFLSAVQKMKGSGSVSNIEGDKAQAAIAALSTNQSEDEFRKNLIEYANTIKRTMNTASSKIGEAPDYPDVPKAGSMPPSMPAPYKDPAKEQRYQEWLKKRNQGQQ
jgi:hypothetical protein